MEMQNGIEDEVFMSGEDVETVETEETVLTLWTFQSQTEDKQEK